MSKEHLSHHDRFVRKIMSKSEAYLEFFEKNLPANIKADIDLTSIMPQKDSFIDDQLKLQITDLLYTAQFNNRQGYIYLLVEHSSTQQHLLPFRMLKYVIAVMDHHITTTKSKILPIIVPIIFHSGKRPYTHSTNLFDLFGDEKELAKNILWKPCQLIDLATIDEEELEASLWYGLPARFLKNIHTKDMDSFIEKVMVDLRAIEKTGKLEYIYTMLNYAVEAGEIKDGNKFKENIRNNLVNIEEEKVMTLAEQYRQRGIQEGRQEGILQGIMKGKSDTAFNMLKLGIDKRIIVSVTGISIKEIEELENSILV